MSIKNGVVEIGDTLMDYAVFGNGRNIIVMIPGLSDGLQSVKGMAFPLAFSYRKLGKDNTVYTFSRKRKIPAVYTSREMAADLVIAMKKLGIEKANIIGVSQGGTIAQFVAVDYPEIVDKLILTVTYSKANETVKAVVSSWIELAENKNYHDLFIEITEKAYTENSLKKMRWLYPVITRFTVPKSFDRFITMATACITHDAYDYLHKITCPTLIIGGADDKIVTARASEEMAEIIPDSLIYMYEGLGHSAFEEAKDFQQRVLDFIGK